jgi:DNA-binding CsgD family transcriptional regulator
VTTAANRTTTPWPISSTVDRADGADRLGHNGDVAIDDQLAAAGAALQAGRWAEARDGFEAVLVGQESAEACFGLGVAAWWLGDNRVSVAQCTRAYTLYRRGGDVAAAVRCAVWLAITYKSNFANFAAAAGWLNRAERLLTDVQTGPESGWVHVARAYRLADLGQAERLTAQALDVAREAGDIDLELVALAQLGLIRVGGGDVEDGFALIDEAMVAALAGERTTLDTVVYTCCDMLNACELASDLERAAQWCQVADDFVARYGCPFLYAECRIYYGSVLTATGRWDDAERELRTGLRITEGACPGLHARAQVRLGALRVRQGRLDEAEQLLAAVGDSVDTELEAALTQSALLLARGDATAAGRNLEQRLHHLAAHRAHLAAALELLADAALAVGDLDAAGVTARRLSAVVSAAGDDRSVAAARAAQGRVAAARGERGEAEAQLEAALSTWSRLELPFETARTRFELARVMATTRREVAVDHARRALQGFEELGASADADRVAAFLRSVGVVARTGRKGVGLLTDREQEVLRLLAVGLSNPEIAARLHVSRKTASHHVSSILSKLHLRNRAEAAAYAAGLPPGLPAVAPPPTHRR